MTPPDPDQPDLDLPDLDQRIAGNWHILLCKPNQNHIALKYLKHAGIDLLMPQHMVERRWRGRLRTEQRPLFAGYIFFSASATNVQWPEIKNTPGVSQIVGFGQNGPASVPIEIIAGLMQRCDSSGLLKPVNDLAAGDEIRITSGPFAEFISKIEKVDAEKRVHVLLELLGQHTRVVLDPERVVRKT